MKGKIQGNGRRGEREKDKRGEREEGIRERKKMVREKDSGGSNI